MPFLIPVAVALATTAATTAISGGFSGGDKPQTPDIPFDQTPEGINKKREQIARDNMKRQQSKFGQEDTILSGAASGGSQSFRGNTLLGGAA